MADTINLETSQKIISVQGLNHYHKKAMIEVDEKIAGISGAVVDDSLSATTVTSGVVSIAFRSISRSNTRRRWASLPTCWATGT